MLDILLLILLGLVAGALSGMGIGGGVVLIPTLTILFSQTQHAAQSVNLVYFLPTALFSLFVHAKNKQIEMPLLPKGIIGGVIGAVAGSLIALNLQADVLRKIFAGFLFIMGVIEFFKKGNEQSATTSSSRNT